MAQLVAQFWRGERVFLLCGQSVEETFHIVIVNESPILRLEELIQVECVLGLLAIDLHALCHFALDDVGHLVCEHVELRQVFIWVAPLRIVPVPLGLLFVRIRPVVDRVFGEFVVRDGLERRSGQVQRVPAFDMVEGNIRLVRVHAFVSLINDEQIILVFRHILQLVVMTAELNGALQILQADELDGIRELALACKMQVFVVADAVWPASQSVHTADEPPAGIGADELGIVVIPGIRNCGTVRHNEDALRLAILAMADACTGHT